MARNSGQELGHPSRGQQFARNTDVPNTWTEPEALYLRQRLLAVDATGYRSHGEAMNRVTDIDRKGEKDDRARQH